MCKLFVQNNAVVNNNLKALLNKANIRTPTLSISVTILQSSIVMGFKKNYFFIFFND
jgi:hypothetical protein